MQQHLKDLRSKCTEKQARYAEALVVKGLYKREAYKEAGYKATTGQQATRNANRLMTTNAPTMAYIDALRGERVRKTGFTRFKAQEMLEKAYRIADAQKNSVAMVSAVRALAALFGLEREAAPNLEAPGASMSTEERKSLEAADARRARLKPA